MEMEESKISVWVCQEEKLISGLSRRTTCSDVVRVLLEDQSQQPQDEGGSSGMLSGSPQSYCIVEKWRGFERILPNKTKILRLWGAWGEEQDNVRFVLVKIEASLPNNGPRSAEARVVLSKESPCNQRDPSKAGTGLPPDKQRRVVRKAFRKLAKINKKRKETLPKDASSVEKMETLVHLVLSQDHTIRQQIQRVMELDQEIDRYEAKVHFDRMKRHGVNYVQDTYLVGDRSNKDSWCRGPEGAGEVLAELEEYAQQYEEVLQLQEELSRQEQLIEDIANEIQEELNQRWMERRKQELCAKESSASSAESEGDPRELSGSQNEAHLEQERVKTQLSTSLYIGLRLNTDLEALKGDLDYTQRMWQDKELELHSLLEAMGDLEAGDNEAMAHMRIQEDSSSGIQQDPDTRTSGDNAGIWVEQEQDLCKNCTGNDEDSDTGLSSMHSQDSDSIPAVCESLV